MLTRLLACLLLSAPLSAQQVTFSDSHVHLNAPESWMRLMSQTGIDRAVILAGRSADNAALLDAARRWPGRVLPFASVSPEHREFRSAWTAKSSSLGGYLDSLLATRQFVGIGEISVSHFPGSGFPEADFSPLAEPMLTIMGLAQQHRVPVLIHCEITRLQEFEELLRRFPGVSVIWAHGGYTPAVVAERFLERYPNLTYELSARSWPDHPRSPEYTILQDRTALWPAWKALLERYPTRFVIGTDAGGRSTASDSSRIVSVQRLLEQLTATTRRQIAHDNLSRLLQRPD